MELASLRTMLVELAGSEHTLVGSETRRCVSRAVGMLDQHRTWWNLLASLGEKPEQTRALQGMTRLSCSLVGLGSFPVAVFLASKKLEKRICLVPRACKFATTAGNGTPQLLGDH